MFNEELNIDNAKSFPIEEILNSIGCKKGIKNDTKAMYSSPFSSDSNPSFCVYLNENKYNDFSTGEGGDSIDLVRKLENISFPDAVKKLNGDISNIDSSKIKPINKKRVKEIKEFNPSEFVCKKIQDVKEIKKYALSRGIKKGYIPSIIDDFSSGEKKSKLSIMFLHETNGIISGAKFRFIDPDKSRFTARGKLNLYILRNIIENHFLDPVLYICESETSANSLWELMKKHHVNGVVISMGGIGAKVEIPKEFDSIKKRYVIIDYDGDELKYNERIATYDKIATPLKIKLEKGDDLNSLYSSNRIEEYKNLIFV